MKTPNRGESQFAQSSGTCIHCGCTDYDCSQCIERTGTPCYWANQEQTICSACVDTPGEKTSYTPVHKTGRAWNGFHLDAGHVVHAIEGEEPNGYWGGKALCGTEPGMRSNGWGLATDFYSRSDIRPSEITCKKCLNKIKKEKQNGKSNLF